MAPFPRKMVHEVAAGRELGEGYSWDCFSSKSKRRPKPLREWLDRNVPEASGVPRSYGLYTSTVVEVVRHARHPSCTTPPEKPLNIPTWQGTAKQLGFHSLLRINIILIGSRAAFDTLSENDRLSGGHPAWGSAERISPAQIAGEFDMHTCAVAMQVGADLEPQFVHSDKALQCATEGCIELTSYAFCSEKADRTNAIFKVLERIEKYTKRGFQLG
eukprot:1995211-Prymnesium_polylepis.2